MERVEKLAQAWNMRRGESPGPQEPEQMRVKLCRLNVLQGDTLPTPPPSSVKVHLSLEDEPLTLINAHFRPEPQPQPGQPPGSTAYRLIAQELVLSSPNLKKVKYKLSIEAGNFTIGKASFSGGDLAVGTPTLMRLEVARKLKNKSQVVGTLELELTALNFGFLATPEQRVQPQKHLQVSGYVQTFTTDEEKQKSVEKKDESQIQEIKPAHITRAQPPIGTGSLGTVYRGTLKGVSAPVAIKDMQFNATIAASWKKEVEFQAAHSCPYIVKIFGFSHTKETLSVVMELAERGTLYDLLHKVPLCDLPLLCRVSLLRHACLATAFLHNNRIIHRDIKTLNILVTESWVAKLTDFGLAREVPENRMLRNPDTVRGTPLYLAPEIRAGSPYDLSADMFSLGVVLYELLERKLPQWDSQRSVAVFPPSYSSISLVTPLLSVDPKCRPPAAAVARKIDELLGSLLTGQDHKHGDKLDLYDVLAVDNATVAERYGAFMARQRPTHVPQHAASAPILHSGATQRHSLPQPVLTQPASPAAAASPQLPLFPSLDSVSTAQAHPTQLPQPITTLYPPTASTAPLPQPNTTASPPPQLPAPAADNGQPSLKEKTVKTEKRSSSSSSPTGKSKAPKSGKK